MIVNISSASGSTKFEADTVTFSEDKQWDFSVLSFIGVFKNKIKNGGIYALSTNMIERDDGNAYRTINFLYIDNDSYKIIFTPTQKMRYKLRFHDLSNTVFNLRSIRTNEIIVFSEIAFQLEIRETYGRF